MIWELVFMLVILKIPVVYLCAVVWWAIRAEPEPPDGVRRSAEPVPAVPPACPRCGWRRPRVAWKRPPVRPRPGRVAA